MSLCASFAMRNDDCTPGAPPTLRRNIRIERLPAETIRVRRLVANHQRLVGILLREDPIRIDLDVLLVDAPIERPRRIDQFRRNLPLPNPAASFFINSLHDRVMSSKWHSQSVKRVTILTVSLYSSRVLLLLPLTVL